MASNNSRSSRRKPNITRKIVEDSNSSSEDKVATTQSDESDSNLPEGTVVVKPEAVEDSGTFSGPEFFQRKKRVSDPNAYLSIVTCTSCHKQINISKKGSAKRHPDLGVLICRRCHEYHISGPITKDEDGLDEQCRWCSEGGRLFGCDFCNNSFCRACIVHNLGRAEVMRVDEDEKWKCYICDGKPIAQLVEQCATILKKIDEARKQKKEKEKAKKSSKEKKEKPTEESMKKSSSTDELSKSSSSSVSSSGKDNKNGPQAETTKSISIKIPNSNSKYVVVTPSMASKSGTNRPSVFSSSLVNNPPVLSNVWPRKDNFNVSLNPTAGLEFERTQAIHGLPAFFALFKSSLTVSNVTAVTDRLLGMSGNLKNLTSSIRANITATDASQMSLLSQQSRKTAVDCIVNCMELFLQELQMAVCGVPVDFKNVRIVDKQKSDTGESVSKSNSVTIVLDSDNEDAYTESTSKEDKEMETNKDDKVASVKKETIPDETRSVSENTSCASTDMETLPSVEDETVANLDKIKELAENMIEKKAKGQTSHNKTKNTEHITPSKRESKKKEEKKKGKDSIDDEESDSEEIATPTKNKILRKLDKGKSKDESKEQIVPNSKEKKEKEKELDEDSSDDEDSSSDEELATPKKRRSLRRLDKEKSKNSANDSKEKSAKKHKKQSSRTKQENKGSDSSGFDSDLEKEINSLSKEPKSKGKDKSVDKDESSKQSTTKSKESRKTKKKANDDDEDGSDSNVTENYDSSEAAEDAPVLDNQPEDDHMASGDEPMEASENTKAKEDLLNELDSSSSSELESMYGATKKESKPAKTSKSKDDESEGSDTKPARKSRPKDKLLDAKLSEDSDSDFVASSRGKKRKVADSRGEKSSDNNPEKNSDSDFEIGKKSKKKKKKNDSDDASSEEVSEDSDSSSDTKSKKKKGKSGKKGKGKATKKGSNGKKRRRIKQPSDSSDEKEESSAEDDDDENAGSGDENSPKKRKKIRKIKSDKKLKDSTKIAVKAEEERRQRVAEKQKLYNAVEVEDDPSSPTKCPKTTKLVLEIDNETKEPVIEVHKELVTKLKPHQVEAVQFLWDCTIESLKRLKKEKGAGCILAHCMGLGKTLSVISFLHTVMVNSDKTKIERVLVVSPLNTVLNWQYEFEMWVQSFDEEFFEVFELTSVKQNFQRADVLKHWHKHGGIMIIGYEMFRNLSQGHHCRNKKLKNTFRECLVDPGPDLVVCDEGHLLKNDASALSKAMNQIKTLRRVVLTGTPLQNNLMEYHCMVSFVKPNLLGTRKEFGNRFVNPIVNGQCADSTSHDVRLMKRRAHILHEKLAGCVQRRDYSALVKFLSPKYEYVLSVRLSPVQMTLYDKYLDISKTQNVMGKGAKLFSDYQALMRIWTHPWVLKMDEIRQEAKGKWIDEDSFIDDEEELSDIESVSSSSSSSSDNEVNNDDDDTENKEKASKSEVVKRWTTRSRNNDGESALGNGLDAFEIPNKPFSTEWWAEYVSEDDEYKMELSGKLVLLFEILKMCEEIGDKVLVFSQSLLSLDLIEKFLNRVDEVHQAETAEKDTAKKKKEKDGEENDKEAEDEPQFGKHWTKGEDYFRMDGSVGAERRKELANAFNDPDNYKARLFIISTKAGGLGINLVAANRVIIFDASWNPSHDVQSIFRVYRFGQTKPVYVYRFLAQGTMEEKIYERQVTKQSLSQRVVDEHQIERHFNSADLQELYTFKPDRLDDPNRTERPTPELPKDHLLAELLKSKKEWLVSYHVHDSLLENQIDQELTEEERKAAWKEYEDERQGISNQVRQTLVGNPMMNANMMMGGMGMMANPYAMMAGGALNQANLLQLVQDMKAKYPHLPEDQLTARVQTVIRQMITNQYMQQQQLQKQFERRELKHQQQLQAIQAQIQRQQQMQGYPSTSMGMAGPPIRHPYNGPEVNKK